MKAEMNDRGVITLHPETPVEAYALKQWARENYIVAQPGLMPSWDGGCLIVSTVTQEGKQP